MSRRHTGLLGLTRLICLGVGLLVWRSLSGGGPSGEPEVAPAPTEGASAPAVSSSIQPIIILGEEEAREDTNEEPSALAQGLQAVAAQGDHLSGFADPTYETCLDQVEDAPTRAAATAEAWRQDGGGTAALHCAAFAQARLANFGEAAQLFDIVASRLTLAEPALAATSFVAAGVNWGEQAKAEAAAGDEEAATQTFQAALTAMEQALQTDPNNPDNAVDFAILLAEFSFSEEAFALLDQALSMRRNHPAALWFKAQIHLDLGQPEEALQLLDRLQATDPTGPYGQSAAKEAEVLRRS